MIVANNLTRRIIKMLRLSVAWIIIVAAILFTLIHLSTSLLVEHYDGFERLVSRAIGHPVRFARVEAHWQGFEPTFGFKRVNILTPDGSNTLIQIKKLRVSIDLLASLFHQQLIPGKIILSGMDLDIAQQENGQMVIYGILEKATQGAAENLFDNTRFADLVAAKPQLQLHHVNIKWKNIQEHNFKLNNLKLNLASKERDHYTLRGQVLLTGYSSNPITFVLDVIGKTGANKNWQVKGYVKGQAIALKTLMDLNLSPHIKRVEGISDVELWFHGAPKAWSLDSIILHIHNPGLTFALPEKTKRVHVFFDQKNKKNDLHLACHWIDKTAECDVKGQGLNLDFNDWFSRAIPLNHFSFRVQWQPQTAGETALKISYFSAHNSDINLTGEMNVYMNKGKSPELNVLAQYDILPRASIADYLPLHLFNAKAVSWIQHAVINHKKATGDLVLQGPIKAFPFDHQEGTFMTHVDIQDVSLKYDKQWPTLSKLAGKLTFRGRGVEFEGNKGQCYNAHINHLQATISNLSYNNPIHLEANASIDGNLEDGLRFLKESPLAKRFGPEALKHMQLSGPMSLNMALTVPIAKSKQSTQVTGEVSTQLGEFVWLYPKIKFSRIRTKVLFTQDAISAKDLDAILWEEPITVELNTIHTKQNKLKTLFARLEGRVDVQQLAKLYGYDVQSIMSGRTRYQATLNIPMSSVTKSIDLHAASNLYGIAVDFMPIFKKTAVNTVPAELHLKMQPNQPFELYSKLGDVFATAMQFSSRKGQLKFHNMNFQLGGGQYPAITKDDGLYITGALPNVNDGLMRMIKQTFATQSRRQTSPWKKFINDHLKGIDLKIESLKLYGQTLKQTALRLEPLIDVWKINIDSQMVKGQLTVPRSYPKFGTLKANMQYALLSSGSFGATAKGIKPEDIGNLNVVCQQTRYGEKSLGRLSFQTKVSSGLLQVLNIQAGDRGWVFHGSGDWHHNRLGDQTNFIGQISIHDARKMLHDWDYPASIKGKGKINFNLKWPGAPCELNREQLKGQVKIAMSKGHLAHIDSTTQAKIGLGRLINLLSVANLQRAVKLDFRGLFGKELNFDEIMGIFGITNGDIHTSNTILRGPIADVDIRGRIGLQSEDLSLKVGVSPHVTGSLPVVAAVAGGPVIGAATWLVEKLANPLVKKVTHYEYQVTGTWDKPEVKPR